ncbi:hypothetical protein AAHB37_02865 [Glutamicibacter halophytocola]|uniref:hypothetical protein n=1 Tax=Glutamicibacter halophytocola TaxID=1933880 RepID=UPI00321965AC
MVTKRGEHYYNFWRDSEHRLGLWRRTTWQSYLTDAPEWEVLLDLDALAIAEGQEWHFAGSSLASSTEVRTLRTGADSPEPRRWRSGARPRV